MSSFPVNRMKHESHSGFFINYFSPHKQPTDNAEDLGVHRDDFYMFFLVEKGTAKLMVDMHDVTLQTASVYFALPGQVHRRFAQNEEITGWFIAVEPSLIPSDYRDTFDTLLSLQTPLSLTPSVYNQCSAIISLLSGKYHEAEDVSFSLPVMTSLLHAFLGIAAGLFSDKANANPVLSRTTQITLHFKKLLVQHMFSVKSPSAYAAMMNISESYLNESVRKNTGFPVSYWIQHQVVLEAKRLLFYTQLSAKEIAHQLGFEDTAYFSRLFKNVTGLSPLLFREGYRK